MGTNFVWNKKKPPVMTKTQKSHLKDLMAVTSKGPDISACGGEYHIPKWEVKPPIPDYVFSKPIPPAYEAGWHFLQLVSLLGATQVYAHHSNYHGTVELKILVPVVKKNFTSLKVVLEEVNAFAKT